MAAGIPVWRPLVLISTIFIAFLGIVSHAHAQDTAAEPDSSDLAELRIQFSRLTLQNQIMQQQIVDLSNFSRLLGGSDTSRLSGDVTLQAEWLKGDIDAYGELDRAANTIAAAVDSISSGEESTLWILEPENVTALRRYQVRSSYARNLITEYQNALRDTSLVAVQFFGNLTPYLGLVGLARDFTALFRTTTTLTPFTTEAKDPSLIASVARALRTSGSPVRVMYPNAFLPADSSGFLHSLALLSQLRARASRMIQEVEGDETRKGELPTVVTLKAINEQFDQLVKGLFQPDTNGELEIDALVLAEAIRSGIDRAGRDRIGLFKVVKVGGASNDPEGRLVATESLVLPGRRHRPVLRLRH